MKKRLLASLLSVCLIVGLFPAALAVDETPGDEAPAVCKQLEGCVEGAHDEECPLYAAPEEPEAVPEQEAEPETELESVYTLRLTHVFRYKLDGKSVNVQASEVVSLTEADFVDGVCDLNRFVYDAEQLTVTRADTVRLEDFGENGMYGARIVYAVSSGWRIVRKADAAGEGTVLREVFNGKLGDYEFVPANVVRIKLEYKYSTTGGLAGIDVEDPDTVEAIPTEQAGTYKVEWTLPTKDGFRIVLDPRELNKYVVSPPTENESEAELAAKLENGDFDVDIASHTIYYYQEQPGQNTHPVYQNRYSTEYNQAWNDARTLTVTDDKGTDLCTATAVGDNTDPGASALENPQLEVTLTEKQLKNVLENGTDLKITVFYRRNATWYTVNHWVPKTLSGLNDTTGYEIKTDEDGTEYVRLEQETLQGRVGALTRAKAKTTAAYEKLQSVGFSQKLIENENTVVDIDYKAADSYRVIFDTDYTYIPRQQVALGSNVDFSKITTNPTRTGYTFEGWRYLKKDATLTNGEYNDDQYVDVAQTDGQYTLKVDETLIAAAKLTESGGVLALHLYPKWTPAQTQVRVILWTEDLTGTDDVQAIAQGGNTTYYDTKYANYKAAPVTHEPQLGTTDSYYSNAGSFVLNVQTDSSLLKANNTKALLDDIQTRVTNEFKSAMGQASDLDVADFYKQAAFEIVHEEEGKVNYDATTASADGKTTIYVYFTRNIYELLFTYYGRAAVGNNTSDYCVPFSTNGYSFSNGAAVPNGVLDFDYSTSHKGGSNTDYTNGWMRASVQNAAGMPVPQTITIRAKYGADLRDVWPVARSAETVASLDNPGNRGTTARMISWGTTDGKYNEGGYFDSGASNAGEPTIMGTYAAMSSEIIADPKQPVTYAENGTVNSGLRHNLVAYWFNGNISHYRNNHCFEVPDLNVNDNSIQKVSIYNNDTNNEKNFLYLVPTDNAAIAKYDFNDLMRVSLNGDQITYNDPDGGYYAVRAYTSGGITKYYAVARQVDTVSSNKIGVQNPSARLHMTKANQTPDHSTEYTDGQGEPGNSVGTQTDPYDLYFYYDRDRYTITYMAPINNSSSGNTEVTLGTVTLPYGAQVTKEKYAFNLDYQDTNQTQVNGQNKYGWTTTGNPVSVCPDRHTDGTAAWTFKGWALGPAGVNMQWTMNEDTEAEGQAGDTFAIAGNLRLYAIWDTPTYTVTFHLGGGTVGNTANNIVENVPANRRYSSTENVIPRPLKGGYTLEGWYVADVNGNIQQPEKVFTFDEAITSDMHVAAKWTAVSTETFSYTVYYLAETLREIDKDNFKDTKEAPDPDNPQLTKTYFVLKQDQVQTEMFIENMTKNLTAKKINGYVPKGTNFNLEPEQADEEYDVFFYYDPIVPGQHVVNFVLAGTEAETTPTIVKTMTVEADQTVVTPQSAAAKDLTAKGYALVSRTGDAGAYTYTAVAKADELKWIDPDGNVKDTATLKDDDIPQIITYLVRPITYTITYKNAAGSPTAADAALAAVTAAENTSVDDAGGKNPTQYTTKDTFTAKNPERVFANGKWYQFKNWTLGDNTSDTGNKTEFTTLKVDPNTVGNLTFVANWAEVPDTDLGSLTVSKTVAGDAGDTDKYFNFTVTLDDTAVTGTFGEMEFTNGVATFTLKHNGSKTATGLLAGIGYTVTETEANQDGYTTTSTGATGTIAKDATATAAFTNTKNSTPVDPETGNLTVSKTVAGDAGDKNQAFNFTVTLSNKTITDTFGDMTFTNGVAAFTLKHGESKTASGLPANTTYEVKETAADGYTTTSTGATGTIEKDKTATAAFTNTKNNTPVDPGTGSLTVSKTVTGNAGDKTKDFTFTVELSDTNVNGTFGDMTFTDGVATFTLKHGESKTATGLTAGITYEVTETEADRNGYTTTSTGATGTIAKDATATAAFTNTKKSSSGGSSGGGGGSSVLNTDDHYSYIIGYKDGTLRPYGTITRGEVATIFFRLLTDEARDEYWDQDSGYSDCGPDLWCNNAISTLSNMGIIDGFQDGTFRPYAKITRAQFAKIAVGFFETTTRKYQGYYSDVPENAWFTDYVEAASRVGLIQGFEDGTFRPNVNITRAQACVIVNRALNRKPDEDHLLPERKMLTWPDNNPGDWFYADMQEATNSHDYTWLSKGSEKKYMEEWTKKLEQRDWAAFEHAWSTAHSAPGGEVVK